MQHAFRLVRLKRGSIAFIKEVRISVLLNPVMGGATATASRRELGMLHAFRVDGALKPRSSCAKR